MDESKTLRPGYYALMSLPATAMGIALCVQISALSWLLSTQLGLNIEEVGYVWLAGPLAGILGQVIIGVVSDRVWFWNGRRRPFILVGGAMASLMLLALPNIRALSESLHLSLMTVAIGVALTLDLAINIGFNPTRSIIADVTPEGPARTRGFTWMQTISGCFGVLSYLVGAQLGNFVLIYLGAAFVFLFAIFPPLFIHEPRHLDLSAGEKSEEGESKAPHVREAGELLKIYLAHAFAWLGIQTMFVYMIAFIKGRFVGPGLDDATIGRTMSLAFFVLNFVGFLLPALFLEPISKRLGRVRTHAACMGLMALGYLGIATSASSPTSLYALISVVGIGWAATVSLPFAIFSEKVDPAKMGTEMGIFNLSVVVPQVIVSWHFGRIIDQAADKSIVFFISAAALGASALLWLLVKDKVGQEGPQSGRAIGGHH